jgi:hypothetical protein
VWASVAVVAVLALGGLGFLGLSTVGASLWWVASAPAPEEPPVPALVAPEAAPQPDVAPMIPAAPVEVPPPVRSRPGPVPAALPAEEAPPAEPEPPPELAEVDVPEAGGPGELRVLGDVPRVYLRSAAGTFAAGPVPDGVYDLVAWFGEEPVTVSHELRVEPGQVLTVRCSAALRMCR